MFITPFPDPPVLFVCSLISFGFQLRVIRAFRSNLEDLSERRSMHSLHSLRTPRTAASNAAVGHPLYNINLLSPNYSSNASKQQHPQSQSTQKPTSQQQQKQQHLSNATLSPLPADISYIDEDPQQQSQSQQQRNLRNGCPTTSTHTNSSASHSYSPAASGGGGFSDIRVVNAFRQGLDARYGEHTNTSLAEVLRKQTSLSKRLSETSSIDYADNIPDELHIPEIDVERLSSHSHTETAV
ncbi:GH23620 [Drosophila grimshawi]|uniref:GH23620 n=1 Tax=Drosophila grimshawi TaxID=7222 RepID=B4K077_DROGR|nr:GH23620 [Drosophila grimshawi]